MSKPDLPYRSRAEAGRLLAGALGQYKARSDVVVLGLTRGGVPVAAEVANALEAPLDVVVVRKLGVPVQPELAMGAIAPGNTCVLDQDLIRAVGLSAEDVENVLRRERAELERRESLYRSGRPAVGLRGRSVIVVDDGIATGATMLAAVRFIRKQAPRQIVVAIPVASEEALDKLRPEVDQCACLAAPEPFYAVGEWYWNFPQTNDAEVMKFLDESLRRKTPSAAA